MGRSQQTDPLERYRSKRRASATPEPFGAAAAAVATPPGEAGRFVVQKHAARRLHYDFRLEHGGVLLSWAVPKGPSADPAEKRLAVHVEDHPIEYADFEGVIPEGNYGAGAVIVWDQGRVRFLSDPDQGLAKGKLLFELQGYKLRGEWTLVKTKQDPKSWLLMKHRDAFADPGGRRPPGEESVLSGRTLEMVREGTSPAADLEAEAARLGAARRRVDLRGAGLMLAESRQQPFSGEGWLFELKYDGFRLLAARDGAAAVLRYRSGADASALYPEVVKALKALPCQRALLDGEVVVLDASGKPSFQGLQKRAMLSRAAEVERAAVERPATLFAFDLLALGEHDLRPLPLRERKALLQRLLPRVGPLRYADHVEARGEDLFREARARGLEGVVAKRGDAPYRAGRSPAWLKVRVQRADDFAGVGFTEPAGSRAGFGALHLAFHDGAGFVYAGSVGSGFSAEQLEAIRARLEPRRRRTPPFRGAVPPGRENAWVEPELVAEVRYLEWTEEGLLRHPVFERLREDKRPQECARPGSGDEPPPVAPASQPERRAALTNLDKVFWPEEGYTKGDLLEYYRAIAPWLLPYLRDRPLVLTRFPDGIAGKSFFQKDAPEWTPSWIRTARVWSEETRRDIDHFLVDDVESLLHVANLGTIPIHVWSSRLPDLARPDWTIIDLDPKGAPFAHVVAIARALHDLCESIGLPSFVKTTGQDGLHVLVPLGGQATHQQGRDLALVLARQVADEMPEVATLARAVQARGGRVYLDCFQNGQGKTIAAPFSVRPRPGATASAPLAWREVNAKLDPRRFTIRTLPARMRRLGDDPLRAVLDLRPDLVGALGRLAEREAARQPRPDPAPDRGVEARRGPPSRRRR
ncbi:MAG TPA: DNA ligase D [Anaeromyxobacteraceae bacterium]|nr:DNA ligase D [Anaeromyxobacteraceae bacterium]